MCVYGKSKPPKTYKPCLWQPPETPYVRKGLSIPFPPKTQNSSCTTKSLEINLELGNIEVDLASNSQLGPARNPQPLKPSTSRFQRANAILPYVALKPLECPGLRHFGGFLGQIASRHASLTLFVGPPNNRPIVLQPSSSENTAPIWSFFA